MPTPSPASLLAALGVLAAFELAYLAYRQRFPRLLERMRYQLCALAVAAWAVLRLWRGPVPTGTSPAAWIELVAVVSSVYLAWRLVARLWLSQLRDERGRLAVPKLVRDLIGWTLLFSAVVVTGHTVLGLDYSRFLLPSAVVSAVLGFALQDVLKNVFAGLALQLEAPFDTGDWLLVDGVPQQVLEMSWRSTHLRDNLGHDFREPNANLASARIENLGSGAPPMGFEIEVGVVYGAAPRQVKDALEIAARNSPAVAASPQPIGLLTAFGDSGVVYRLRFWSHQVQGVARLLDEVRTRVWYELKRQGFVIPFPIRTVEHASRRDLDERRAAARLRQAEELFARVEVLAALPGEVRSRLAATATHLHFDERERLVNEGEAGGSLYVVARGRVQVAKSGTTLGTTQVSLATLEPGDCFGEMSLLTGAPRSATVSALGAVEVFVLERSALAPVLHDDPTLADTLSHVLAKRVAATIDRIESRRDELARRQAVEQRSILQKIRGFFGLGD
jgi:small-conductance mechanosensitive channel/CRP-like cAMP-binding protein